MSYIMRTVQSEDLRQPASSEPSSQSSCLSHFHLAGMHPPPTPHENSSAWQPFGGRDAATDMTV